MKRSIYYIVFAAALAIGLWGCQQKQEAPQSSVELRYRANDSYSLPCQNAASFTILVASTEKWTVTSEHPDWCIISEEEGDASDAAILHVGQAEATVIRVQYYDNTALDDRIDHITIQSDGWVGKRVEIIQKGNAYISVPEQDLEQTVVKAGGEYYIHVLSNQDWSAKVTGGNWISISDGASGSGDGFVTVQAHENSSEMRYAQVTVYDRLGAEVATTIFTQDGVQLVPAATEIRAGYDQLSAELSIVANAKWRVEKASDADTWFTIDTPAGEGNGTIKLSLTVNEGTGLRRGSIILKNVVENPDDAAIEKEIVVKQAYQIVPKRTMANADEADLWKSDQSLTPSYRADLGGMLFPAPSRWNRSMPFGTYNFRWSSITPGARVRHWFCFSDGIEIKADIRPASAKVSFDFNAASSGASGKPSLSAYTDVDFTQPVELTYKFDPSGANFCHVTLLVNGVEAGSFDTSADILHTVTWGASINMYIGVYEEGQGSSAVLEWYEYTEPMNWED